MHEPIRVAVVQETARPLDLAATLEQTLSGLEDAARQGAQLVVFGETWLGGYPAWLDHCPEIGLWDHPAAKSAFARYRRACPTLDGPEIARLRQATADLGVAAVVGLSERVDQGPGQGTLYNSLLTLGADGSVLNHHRKLMPTHTERLVWGQGDGRGLRSVKTPFGRLGGLICWEHWMPLARHTLHLAGETIHVAVWPMVHTMHQVASRHYAFEGRCFVLAAGQRMRAGDLPEELERRPGLEPDDWVLRGGSAIYGPDGMAVVEPVFERDDVLIADLDPSAIDRESMTLDVSGHYARPDVFDFALRSPLPEPDP